MRKDYEEGLHPPKFVKMRQIQRCFQHLGLFFLQSISKGSVGMCGNESEISVKLHPKNVSKKKKKKMERL